MGAFSLIVVINLLNRFGSEMGVNFESNKASEDQIPSSPGHVVRKEVALESSSTRSTLDFNSLNDTIQTNTQELNTPARKLCRLNSPQLDISNFPKQLQRSSAKNRPEVPALATCAENNTSEIKQENDSETLSMEENDREPLIKQENYCEPLIKIVNELIETARDVASRETSPRRKLIYTEFADEMNSVRPEHPDESSAFAWAMECISILDRMNFNLTLKIGHVDSLKISTKLSTLHSYLRLMFGSL